MNITEKFLALVRYSIDETAPIPDIWTMEWPVLFTMAKKQAIAGVLFHGLERYTMPDTESQKDDVRGKMEVPREVVLQWFALSEQVKQRNRVMNQRCVDVSRMFEKDGYSCCVLKGQGNALMYPDSYARMSGDIDVWLMPKSEGKRQKSDVIEYVKKKNPEGRAEYHHIDYGDFDGVEVEVHYRPSFLNNLIYNHRLQQWFLGYTDSTESTELPDGVGEICVPTPEFNKVYQLVHMYNHLIHEGIGLRQMMDYYYLLRQAKDDVRCKKEDVRETLRRLGLWTFAGAVMYVMREVFHLEEQYMIAPVDEKRGLFLLEEMMLGGNFGRYDQRVSHQGNRLKQNLQRLRRDVRLMRYFPSECLWEPVFRVYHFCWRMANH